MKTTEVIPLVKVDARGQSCPKPVMMAKEAVDRGASRLEVLVDNPVSGENVTRFLKGQGFQVTKSEGPEGILLTAERSAPPAEVPEDHPSCACPSEAPSKAPMGLLILSRTLGGESAELGEALMKAFLDTMRQAGTVSVVALMNGGVFLSLPDSSASDTLKEMEAQGTRVLVCGTCTKHFGVTDRVCVGSISNMFEITSEVFAAAKPVVIG